MTDDLDRAIHTLMSDVRELAPEPPPYPGAYQPQTDRSRPARVPGWGIAVAAAVLVVAVVGIPLLVAGGSETPAGQPETTVPASTTIPTTTSTTTLAIPPDAARSVQLRSRTIYLEDGHIDLLFPDEGIRGLGWILQLQVAPGDWDGIAWLVSSPLGSERTPQWYPIDEPPAIEDEGVNGEGPDTVVLPPDLALGRYRICDTAGWIPCAEFDLETRAPTDPASTQVAVGYPADGRIVTSPELAINGTVPAGATLTVAGSPVTPAEGEYTDISGNSVQYFEAALTLAPGINTIELVASTEADGVIRRTLDVTYLPGATEEFTFLTRVSVSGVEADYAQWLTGDEATEAAREDGAIPPDEEVPNDFYIRNTNTQLRTLPLSPDVLVILQTSATGGVTEVPVTLDDWLSLFRPDGTPWNPEIESVPDSPEPHFGFFGAGTVYAPYWLTIDDGIVVQVRQQYVP